MEKILKKLIAVYIQKSLTIGYRYVVLEHIEFTVSKLS